MEREIERLRQERDRLKHVLDLDRRAAKRQAAPFSKAAPKPHPKGMSRKAGAQYVPDTSDQEGQETLNLGGKK